MYTLLTITVYYVVFIAHIYADRSIQQYPTALFAKTHIQRVYKSIQRNQKYPACLKKLSGEFTKVQESMFKYPASTFTCTFAKVQESVFNYPTRSHVSFFTRNP